MGQRFRWMLTALGALLAGAFAAEAGVAPGSGMQANLPAPTSTFTVEIWHNAPVASSLTIYVTGPDGMPIRLGRIAPSGTETFTVPGELRGGEYSLTAQTTDGRWIRSLPFSPFESDGVRWDVDRNRIIRVWHNS